MTSYRCENCSLVMGIGIVKFVTNHKGVLEHRCPICNGIATMVDKEEDNKTVGYSTLGVNNYMTGLRIAPNKESKEEKEEEKDAKGEGSEYEWDNNFEEVKECAHIPKFDIKIEGGCYLKIKSLMSLMGSYEWLAYLRGKVKKESDPEKGTTIVYHIHKLFVPKQRVNYSTVEVLDSKIPKNCIGVIHSHHSMGAFFSSVDHDYINDNHDLSIVVSKSSAKAIIRYFPPCSDGKKFFRIESEWTILLPHMDISNIEKPTSSYGGYGNRGVIIKGAKTEEELENNESQLQLPITDDDEDIMVWDS